MKEKFEHIDELFREKMFNYTNPPPDLVWKRIEKSMEKNKRRSFLPLYLKIAAGIIFLAGMTALYLKISDHKTPLLDIQTIAQKDNVKSLSKQLIKNSIATAEHLSTDKYTKILPGKRLKRVDHLLITDNRNNAITNSDSALSNDILSHDIVSVEVLPKNDTIQINSQIKNLTNPYTANKSLNTDTAKIQNPAVNNLDNLLTENKAEKQKTLKWKVGGQAGPQYSYRRITSEDASNINYDSYDDPLMAYAGGLQIQVEPSKRVSIQSGVYYSKIGQTISSRNINYEINDYFGASNSPENNQPVEIVNSIGSIVYPEDIAKSGMNLVRTDYGLSQNPLNANNSTEEFTGQQVFEYIEIPLMMRYKVIAQKIGLSLIGGLNTDILINNSVKITNNDDFTLETKTDDLKTFNYSGTVGFGFDYPISSKILFNIEPFFKYYLNPINESSQAEAQPYIIGIMTGLNYSF